MLRLRTCQSRAGGTKTFLVDENDESYVYKHISNAEKREIDFYRDLTASLDEDVDANRSQLRDLCRNGVISRFYGTVNRGTQEFIKLRNFVHGMKRPVILDIKIGDRAVGSFDGEPGFGTILEIFSRTNSKQREEALRIYKECKKSNTHMNLTFQDLNLPISATSSKDIHIALKHLAQRKRIEDTASSKLGFRIAGSNLTSKSELKMLNAESTIKYISDTFLCVGSTSEKIRRARHLLRALIPLSDYLRCSCHHRFYSSSLLLVYDAQNEDVARVHWVDFTHVYAARQMSSSESIDLDSREGSDKACLRAVQHLKDVLLHIAVDILPYTLPQSSILEDDSFIPRISNKSSRRVFDFNARSSPQRSVSPRNSRARVVSHFSLSEESKDNMLRMVIVVHRHGARFPKKCRKEDLVWPQNETFYKLYSSNLTIHGVFQAYVCLRHSSLSLSSTLLPLSLFNT